MFTEENTYFVLQLFVVDIVTGLLLFISMSPVCFVVICE